MRTPLAILTLLAGAAASHAAAAQMLPVRDQNPLVRGAYLPLPAALEAPADGRFGFAAGVQWSNTVNIDSLATEQMLVDEETVEVDLTAGRDVGDWHLRATLPVIHRGGGVLDSFIEDWHRFFGMPQGQRPDRPRNAFAIEYQRDGLPTVDGTAGTALGDLALEAGRALAASGDGRVELWAGLEVPTGSRSRLTGNGALDAALWLAGEERLSSRWTLAGRAGLSYVGGDAQSGLPLERALGFATLAVDWAATDRLGAVLQLDAHSATARGSAIGFLGSAVQLTVGGRYRLDGGAVFEAGVVEDIEVNHSPDVTFHFGVRLPAGRSAR
jgi:hypothetical protein